MIMSSSKSSCAGGSGGAALSAGVAPSVVAVLVSSCAAAASPSCVASEPCCIAAHRRSTRAALLPLLGKPRCASSPSKSAYSAICLYPYIDCRVRVLMHASSTYFTSHWQSQHKGGSAAAPSRCTFVSCWSWAIDVRPPSVASSSSSAPSAAASASVFVSAGASTAAPAGSC